ncbi:transporter [Allochromatium humboldtianum]|uniref:Transporter n=1 Tax=Allochromatium humboldtianum TaxID=504901 RepID=A0A850RQL0_9GAMM|nr:transporter [Allochromatium humboldtianum]NVZ11193.1 transporter [Allochromatium humboldtianum]
MHEDTDSMTRAGGARLPAAALLALSALGPLAVQAQTPARFYLDTLSGSTAVPLIVESINGNTNPFDPAHTVTPGADFDATLAMVGYGHTFSLFDRSALAAIFLPMGRISGDVSLNGRTFNQSASGFGDPTLEFAINLIGPSAQKDIPDAMRYEPGFALHLLADLALPIGEYDNDQTLNIGMNRWYGRVALPMTWQLGAWVPGRRTTLELLPSVWLFGENSDYVGQTLETEPMFQLDAHLTRDFTEHLWGSLDAVWLNGGAATIDGVKGDANDTFGLGFTLGYSIKENLQLTFGYKSTLNDSNPGDMQMDSFNLSLVFGWHPLIEGSRRLKENQQ